MTVTGTGADARAVWRDRDALVLKWLALQLERVLPQPARCFHVRGRGGPRRLLQQVATVLTGGYHQVCRTDIRGYYRHISKAQCLAHVRRHTAHPVWLDLMAQYLNYSVEQGGEFFTPASGIPRGCALSPLIGASFLHHIDDDFSARPEVFYARYMDDFLLLAGTRWHLRKAVARLNHYFDLGGFEQAREKTYIGHARHGFDWLGGMADRKGACGDIAAGQREPPGTAQAAL